MEEHRAAAETVNESIWLQLEAVALEHVARWNDAVQAAPKHPGEKRRGLLGDMAGDRENIEFTHRLIDALFGTGDAFTSAMGLREVSQSELPEDMPARDRLLLRAGSVASLGIPWIVRPAAQRKLLSRLPDVTLPLKLTGKLTHLADTLRGHSETGHTVLVSLLGDPVHGTRGSESEVERLVALAKHPSVKQLAFDPARIVPGATDWTIDADVALAATRILPLLEAALEHRVRVTVEPRDTVWARNIPEFLIRALASTGLDRVEIGASLLAELPESWDSYARLHRFARQRVADGGAPLEVVISLRGGGGDVAARERVASIHTGLPVQVIEDRVDRTAQFLRLAELALQPQRAAVIRPVIASEDPQLLAAIMEAAVRLGSEKLYALQMRCGVATELAHALAAERPGGHVDLRAGEFVPVMATERDVIAATHAHPEVRLRLPVTQRGEYGGVVEYLVSLIAETADSGSCEFHDVLARAAEPAATSHRTQQRAREWDPSERDSALFYRAPDEPAKHDTGGLTAAVLGLTRGETGELVIEESAPLRPIPVVSRTGFANEPPTDGSLAANREWARSLLRRAGDITRYGDGLDETIALSQADLHPDAAAGLAREAAERWAEQRHEGRAVRLRRAALATAAARDKIITALAADTGAPFPELDAAVSHIIDSARYAGQLADGLRVIRGASFVPEHLVLVVGGQSAPLAAQATAVLGVLGSGAGALWAVSPRLLRSATACVEEWEAGGLTPGAVRLVSIVGDETFASLGASPHVDRAIVLGDRAIGRELARRRPDLRVEGHFVARGSVLVTPSAERDRAITDIVDSAFRGTERSVSGAGAVVLLGSMARSRRFRKGLVEAVQSLRVGDSARPGDADPLSFDIGPLPTPAGPAARAALSELGPGEEWLVQPEQLDDEGRLWSPGVRLGVPPGSPFWDDAQGLPVIGISAAHMLSDAIAQQNVAGSGSVAGIHSWDEREVRAWLDGVEAAALSVNRPTSGVRIERQPSGGWNEAVMGLAALRGGPHWLLAQGSWKLRSGQRSETLHLRGLMPEVVLLIEAAQPELGYEEFDEIRRAALTDQLTWQTDLGVIEDGIGLGVERNALRTFPVSAQIRLAEDGSLAGLVRVLAAALRTRAPVTVSTGAVLPPAVLELLTSQGIDVSLERDDAWLERLAIDGPAGPGGSVASRIRLIGGDRVRVAEWMGGLDRSALWAEPVTMAGPVELLSLLREQSVSVRAERHGFAERAPGLDALLD